MRWNVASASAASLCVASSASATYSATVPFSRSASSWLARTASTIRRCASLISADDPAAPAIESSPSSPRRYSANSLSARSRSARRSTSSAVVIARVFVRLVSSRAFSSATTRCIRANCSAVGSAARRYSERFSVVTCWASRSPSAASALACSSLRAMASMVRSDDTPTPATVRMAMASTEMMDTILTAIDRFPSCMTHSPLAARSPRPELRRALLIPQPNQSWGGLMKNE